MLKYIGKGFFPGIPAKDLTDEEVTQFGGEEYLVGTGLYIPAKKAPPQAPQAPQAPPKPRAKKARNPKKA